jgi:pimeloyl-ACP methyl ester carboxylesterase
VAPSLQGLKSFNFDEDDLTALSDLIIALKVQYGGSIGVIGFSAGGGIALTVAADPAVAEMVDPLLLFSPYYFLPDPWALLKTQTLSSPQNKRDWDHFIWSQLALAYRNLDALNLQTTERDELIDLLYSYCSERSLFRKKEFYERVLLWLDIPNIRTTPISSSTLEQFSPCGKLHRIRGRVLILHDPADLLIPPEHSEKIIAELNLRGKPDAQKLLITPLLSHVTPRSTWRVFDLLRILHLIGELFRR